MPRIWISIGSNKDRESSIRRAVAVLRRDYGALLISTIYESPALGFSGDPFYNLVVGIESSNSPQTIAANLRLIEHNLGRIRGLNKFAPRTIDLDMLTWGQAILCENGISLPRDEILSYAFVLRPLAEIAELELHPQLKQSYKSLWDAFDSTTQPIWPVTLDLG